LNAVFGWWWADPVAGLVMVPTIAKEGVEDLRVECVVMIAISNKSPCSSELRQTSRNVDSRENIAPLDLGKVMSRCTCVESWHGNASLYHRVVF
jgi:hypothetical protein